MSKNNPYNYNLPVGPDMFYGRKENVDELSTLLLRALGDSVAVIGGRRMGKTSILEALIRQLADPSNREERKVQPYPIYIDLAGQKVDSVSSFFRLVVELLESDWGYTVDTKFKDITQISASIFAKILRSWGNKMMEDSFVQARLIIVIDECEYIASEDWTEDLYGALRYLLVGRTTRTLIKIVMAGSHQFLIKARQRGSPLRNVLIYYVLQAFDNTSAHKLIEEPTEYKLSTEVVDAVINQSGCHPFLTQYIMHYLVQDQLDTVTVTRVGQLASDFYSKRNDFWDWINDLGGLAVLICKILLAASTPLTKKQIRAKLEEPNDLIQILEALRYHGIIQKNSNEEFSVSAQMFREWFIESSVSEISEFTPDSNDTLLDMLKGVRKTKEQNLAEVKNRISEFIDPRTVPLDLAKTEKTLEVALLALKTEIERLEIGFKKDD